MRNPPFAFAALLALFLPSLALAQAPALAVSITQPTSGVVDVHGSVVLFAAQVSDPTLRTATLTIHGASYSVPIEHGQVWQRLVVAPGVNRVGITVQRGDEVARDAVTWFVRGEAAELLVLATWEATGEIVDLWVREPGGETCKWDHRSTARGGHLLDFSTRAIGLGSQGYVARQVAAGTYRIKLHYWSASAEEDQRWEHDYDALIAQLDVVERALVTATGSHRVIQLRERDRLLARLDAWAQPAATQTTVHIEAILFPGTPHERRWRFDRRVDRAGQLTTLGEIEIDEGLIRAARAGRE